MKKAAVIVAGGTGIRMGTETPKQFLNIHGKPILVHTVEAFFTAFPEMEIILVLPLDYLEPWCLLAEKYFPGKPVIVTAGGSTRFESVKLGLSRVSTPSVIFVHDAVRCLVSTSLIHLCYETALKSGSAIPVVNLRDSIRRIRGTGSEVIDRDTLRAVQTPQTFLSEIILPAFDTKYQDSFTDEATVVEHSGRPVLLIQGEDINIKITYPADLDFARQVIGRKNA